MFILKLNTDAKQLFSDLYIGLEQICRVSVWVDLGRGLQGAVHPKVGQLVPPSNFGHALKCVGDL